MTYLELPALAEAPRLPFYLAAEEYAATLLDSVGDSLFFMWQTRPTVICGRNQDIALEVDLEWCRSNGVDVCRRKSGGGCVYSDSNNVMMSYVARYQNVETTMHEYMAIVAAMLGRMGFAEAHASSRNDVMLGERKVSGSAFLVLPPDRAVAHGTMLIDLDAEAMRHAITPSRAKLESKGVKSVESRVTTLRSHRPELTPAAFMKEAREIMCGDAIALSEHDLKAIREIEQGYYAPGHLRLGGKGTVRGRRIEGMGEICADIRLDAAGRIADVAFTGDFFALRPIEELCEALKGLRPAEVISLPDPSIYVMGLSRETLASILQKKPILTSNLNNCYTAK